MCRHCAPSDGLARYPYPGEFHPGGGARRKLAGVVHMSEPDAYEGGALLMHHGNISRAARAAQKSRRAFWELIRKHHIDVKTLKLHAS